MADVRDSTRERLSVAGTDLASGSGLRVRPQRPVRALFAGLLIATSVAVSLIVYARIGDRRPVLALTRTVLAGEQVTDADLRVVSLSSDDSFAAVPASERDVVVGQYARVRMVQGALLVADSLQSRPLVDPSKVLMSVPVPLSGIPSGLREGSRLVLIVTPKSSGSSSPSPVLVEAWVAAVPANLGEQVNTGSAQSATVALSVEVPPDRVALIGAAGEVAVGVLDPSAPFPVDPAATVGGAATGTAPADPPAVGG